MYLVNLFALIQKGNLSLCTEGPGTLSVLSSVADKSTFLKISFYTIVNCYIRIPLTRYFQFVQIAQISYTFTGAEACNK